MTFFVFPSLSLVSPISLSSDDTHRDDMVNELICYDMRNKTCDEAKRKSRSKEYFLVTVTLTHFIPFTDVYFLTILQ